MKNGLSEKVTKRIGDQAGIDIFADVLEKARADGRSEVMSYAMAWAALSFQGYHENDQGVWKKATRVLIPRDEQTSKIPFLYEQDALGYLRPDQTPRMLGAITHPENHPVRTFAFDDLVAIQNRVDTQKAYELSAGPAQGPAGIVARFNGVNYILDGHHRIVGRWLAGDQSVDAYFADLEPVSDAMKSKSAGDQTEQFTFCHEVRKISEDQRLVYGWASVIEKDGNPIEDHQGDIIQSSDLVQAAHAFIISSRTAKALHQGSQIGEFVESVVFTPEVQKALGINLGRVGWWVALKVKDERVWKAVKDGKLKMLSIGGRGKRIDNG
jgi:uncharacterized protein YndB with AHSA1/START domain